LLDTGEYEKLYNVRVADFHTTSSAARVGVQRLAHNALRVTVGLEDRRLLPKLVHSKALWISTSGDVDAVKDADEVLL